jgi:hypothetical protein
MVHRSTVGREPKKPAKGRYDPTLISVLDAFDLINVRLTEGYQMIDEGLLDSVLIGERRYVTRQSLERLDAQRRAAEVPPERQAINDVIDAIDAEREPNPGSLETAIAAFEEILTFLRPFAKGKGESQATPPKAAESVR